MVKGTSPHYSWSFKDAVIVMMALAVLVGGCIVVFDIDVEGVAWDPPEEARASYVITISTNATSLDFANGDLGWWPLELSQSPSALVEVRIAVFVNMTDGTYFQLAEYYPEGEEWVSEDMQEDGEETWVSSVDIGEGETRQFAIWVLSPDDERRGTSCRFYLQSVGGKVVVGPV